MKTKTVLITGAGTGIGKDAAKTLLLRGHQVIATTHFDEQVSGLRDELGPDAKVFKLDITNPKDRAKLADHDLDVLINNAALGETGSLAEINIDRVRNLFETNVFSTLELTQLAIKNMVKRGSGTVVFISSVAGRMPLPFFMPYGMTKYALSAGAAGLREEMKVLDKGIHISIVEPGPYATGFNQRMSESRFVWMEKESLFSKKQIEKLRLDAEREFRMTETKSNDTIVNKIVAATEANKPKLRYVAPWWIALYVRLLRALGI